MSFEVRKSTQFGREDHWVVDDGEVDGFINAFGELIPAYVDYPNKRSAQAALDLYLSKQPAEGMRQFNTGATRDGDVNKLDYDGFLSPIVLKRYAQYMHKHRKQADGKLRDSDNWQKGIPGEAYRKSLWRHFVDAWAILRGWVTKSDSGEDIEDLLCAIMFNCMGLLHETLKEQREPSPDRDCGCDKPIPGGY